MTQKSRKIRAIAAGGAVLGVGAAITLAAWSDSEFAFGEFDSGTFGIQAAAGDGVFEDQAAENGPLELTFADVKMVPGETITAPYQIRNIPGGEASVVTFARETIGGNLQDDLSVEVLRTDGAACDLATEGELLEKGRTFNLTGVDPENPAPQNLCVKVTLAEDTDENPTLQGENGTILWQFDAELLEQEAEQA